MNRVLPMVLFGSVVTLVFGSWHFYLWLRLIRDPQLPVAVARLLTALLIAAALLVPLAMMFTIVFPSPIGRSTVYAAYLWLGFSFFLLAATGTGDLLRLSIDGGVHVASWLTKKEFAAGLVAVLHGVAFGRALAATAALLALTAATSGAWQVRQPVPIKEVAVAIAGLPAKMNGLTLVQLTDLHVGAPLIRPFVQQVVDRTNALSPDVIVITGDLIDGPVAVLADQVAPIFELRARHGVFFITGNHEYYSGVAEWTAYLREHGIRVLENERVAIDAEPGVGIDLVGVPDLEARRFEGSAKPDLAAALAGRDRGRPAILLAHHPRQFDEAAAAGIALQLSGHTHGGQIFPFGGVVALAEKYLAGLYRRDDAQLYVSRGTGVWGPPMRLFAPAEITRIVLTATPP